MSRELMSLPIVQPTSRPREFVTSASSGSGTFHFASRRMPTSPPVATNYAPPPTTVCGAIGKPFNFMVGIKGRSFSKAELEAAGVKRISLATSLYKAAMTGLLSAARQAKDGNFGYVDTVVSTAELSGYMME